MGNPQYQQLDVLLSNQHKTTLCRPRTQNFVCCMQDGLTALMLAASSGSSKLVHLFLEAGAGVNNQDNVSCLMKLVQYFL